MLLTTNKQEFKLSWGCLIESWLEFMAKYSPLIGYFLVEYRSLPLLVDSWLNTALWLVEMEHNFHMKQNVVCIVVTV